MPLFRRREVPAEVSSALGPGERLLAWAPGTPAGYAAASDRALYLPVDGVLRRIPWELVDRAAWDRDEGRLDVTQDVPGSRARRWSVALEGAADLAVVVHERVNATVVLSRHVEVVGRRGVTVVARRPPGTDTLTWTARVDRGVDMADPPTRKAVQSAVADVRAEVGG